jgi:hypothetical protein
LAKEFQTASEAHSANGGASCDHEGIEDLILLILRKGDKSVIICPAKCSSYNEGVNE